MIQIVLRIDCDEPGCERVTSGYCYSGIQPLPHRHAYITVLVPGWQATPLGTFCPTHRKIVGSTEKLTWTADFPIESTAASSAREPCPQCGRFIRAGYVHRIRPGHVHGAAKYGACFEFNEDTAPPEDKP
jgi:hypothetical protein